jgi:hypothetical protein
MADIRIKSGKAWLGFSGWGIRLKIYGQAPNSSPVFLAETPAHEPYDTPPVLGNGIYAQEEGEQYLYLDTNGPGTYKIWAEYPDDSNLRAEDTYDFDPDYQGSGDPFDWRTTGMVPDLTIPAKHFIVDGTLQANYNTNELHLVVSLDYDCDTVCPNFTFELTGTPRSANFSQHFAFPTQAATTFHVYARDHDCNSSRSNVETLSDVTGDGETRNLQNTLVVEANEEET